MKKLLFISLLFSVPAWGMEVGEKSPSKKHYLEDDDDYSKKRQCNNMQVPSNETVRALHCRILPQEEKAFHSLRAFGCPSNMEGTEKYAKGAEAWEQLKSFAAQYRKPHNFIFDCPHVRCESGEESSSSDEEWLKDEEPWQFTSEEQTPPLDLTSWQSFGLMFNASKTKTGRVYYHKAFEAESAKEILLKLPYVQEALSPKEFEKLKIKKLLHILNKEKKE